MSRPDRVVAGHSWRALAAASLVAAVPCAATPTASQDRVPVGMWGGTGIALDVTEDGARAEFDCAHGTLGPMLLDPGGSFDVAGTLVVEGPGPIQPEQAESSRPARYSGRLRGDKLTLTVTTDGGETAGTFTARRGEKSQLRKCL